MNDDKLLRELQSTVASDFRPVQPLSSPWRRALFLLLLSIPMAAIVLAVFGLRSDHGVLGPFGTWGLTLLQLSLAYALVALGLRTVIPGLAVSKSALRLIPTFSLATSLAFAWLSFQLSPAWPEAGKEWRTGLACLAAISTLALVPLILGWMAARKGLPLVPRSTGITVGLGGALSAEAVWRLHCPASSMGHVLGFHTSTVVLVSLAGLLAGLWWVAREAAARNHFPGQ